MKVAYFDYSGTPAKLILDEDELPVSCELFDRATNRFVARDDLAPDLWHGQGAQRIGEAAFNALLAKVRSERG